MVAPLYQNAYLGLQSSPALPPLRHVPRKHVASDHLPSSPGAVEFAIPGRFTPRLESQDDGLPDASALHSPAQPYCGLPPTPPQNLQGASPDTQKSLPVYADGVVSSLMSPNSLPSTPVLQRSPPTPDTTPPRKRDLLSASRPSLVSHTPSSFAGSFKTARENPSSEGDDGHHYVPSNASTRSFSGTWSHSAGRRPGRPVPEIGLGLNFEYMAGEGTSAESTPGELHPEAKTQVEEVRDGDMDVNIDEDRERDHDVDSSHLEWDDDRMRNVTLRKRQPAVTTTTPPMPHQNVLEQHSPSLRELAKEQAAQDSGSSKSPKMTSSVTENTRSTPTHEAVQVRLRREDQKRLSSTSSTSNVVEAMVVPSPAPTLSQHRVLRRIGKNISLRNGGELLETHSTPTYHPVEEPPVHRLLHKNSPIPDRKNSGGKGPRIPPQTVSNAENPSSDTIPVTAFPQPPSTSRILEQRSAYTQDTVSWMKQLPPGLDRVGLGYFDIAKRKAPAFGDIPRKNESRVRDSLPTIRLSTTNIKTASSDHPGLRADASSQLATRSLSQHELRRKDLEKQFSACKESSEDWQPENVCEDPLLDDLGLPIMGVRLGSWPSRENGERSTRLDASPSLQTTLEGRRESHETPSIPHSSGDNLLAPHSDHSLARYMHARTSPHSETSTEQADTLEVSQATAVSIYPHHNNSLLVVQQLARPATSGGIEHRRPISSIRSGASTSPTRAQSRPRSSFTAMKSPSTPPTTALLAPDTDNFQPTSVSSHHITALQTQTLDSEPPAFKIIPPTPLSEIESPLSLVDPRTPAKVIQLTGPGVPISVSSSNQIKSTRRFSLRQRARRLSEPILQPLLQARAQLPLPGSNKNRYNLHAHPPSVPSVSEVPQESNRLHPFWRPRGFWDDFSDSDSDADYTVDDADVVHGNEEDDDEPGFLVAGRHATATCSPAFFDPDLDRLPPGGDTSDIASSSPANAAQHLARLSRGASAALTRRLGSLRSDNADGGGGGFLIGNSLGIGRQPSNSRKHVVALPGALRARLAAVGTGGQGLTKAGRSRSVAEGSLHSTSLMRMQRRKGLLQRVRQRWASSESVLAGRDREERGGVEKLGFKVPMKLEGVRERLVGMRKENRRRKLKSRIGKVELVADGQVSQF
ncbi:MAG: hypothetical protein M1821_002083 [Bathelium mastoideum]|nr:MAG: hypothetical protein M1821_002083 [Bathelium mastoideum]